MTHQRIGEPHDWPDGTDGAWLWEPTDEPQHLLCAICGQRVQKGEVVIWPPLSEWAHKACYDADTEGSG